MIFHTDPFSLIEFYLLMTKTTVLFCQFLKRHVSYYGVTDTLFWTSGDISSGFQR